MKLTHLLFVIISGLFLPSCSDKGTDVTSKTVNFPTHIYLEKKSPDNKTNAIIYSWSNADKDDLLGSDDKFILGFTNTKTKWYVDFELSEGFGTYEGGITEIQWLNNNEVLIKRIISDRPKDIKYNLQLNEWTLINAPD